MITEKNLIKLMWSDSTLTNKGKEKKLMKRYIHPLVWLACLLSCGWRLSTSLGTGIGNTVPQTIPRTSSLRNGIQSLEFSEPCLDLIGEIYPSIPCCQRKPNVEKGTSCFLYIYNSDGLFSYYCRHKSRNMSTSGPWEVFLCPVLLWVMNCKDLIHLMGILVI